MFLKIYVVCAALIVCEAAKLGFGNGNNNGRSPSEPSSLKSEIMKYKSSECGGSSSEEDNSNNHKGNKRRGNHRNKKGSDEDESDESDENDNKKKKGGKQRNNRGNNKNRGFADGRDSFGSSFEGVPMMGGGHLGMMERRPPPDDFYNRRPGQGRSYGICDDAKKLYKTTNIFCYIMLLIYDSGPDSYNPWEMNQNRPNNQYPNRGMPNPNPYPNEEFYPHGQQGSKRNPMGHGHGHGQDPYGYQTRGGEQDPYGSNRYNNRDTNNRWNNRGDRDDDSRYNNRGDRDRYNNRDDRYQTRNRNNYGDDYDDSSRGGNRRNGQRNGGGRNGNKRGKNGRKPNKNNSGEECVSQCVFTNMQIMEDDGIPSEAGMIKWAQDKIKNEKLKQAAVKEIRKCFGTLASSDGENSCNFSKSLSSCLKLGLDED